MANCAADAFPLNKTNIPPRSAAWRLLRLPATPLRNRLRCTRSWWLFLKVFMSDCMVTPLPCSHVLNNVIFPATTLFLWFLIFFMPPITCGPLQVFWPALGLPSVHTRSGRQSTASRHLQVPAAAAASPRLPGLASGPAAPAATQRCVSAAAGASHWPRCSKSWRGPCETPL